MSGASSLPRIGLLEPITDAVLTNWKVGGNGSSQVVLLYREGDLYPVVGFGMMDSFEDEWFWFLQEAGPEDECSCPDASLDPNWQPTHYASISYEVAP